MNSVFNIKPVNTQLKTIKKLNDLFDYFFDGMYTRKISNKTIKKPICCKTFFNNIGIFEYSTVCNNEYQTFIPFTLSLIRQTDFTKY
jgi:hypothetical protein